MQLFAAAVDVVGLPLAPRLFCSATRLLWLHGGLSNEESGQGGLSVVCDGAHNVVLRVSFLLSESAAVLTETSSWALLGRAHVHRA